MGSRRLMAWEMDAGPTPTRRPCSRRPPSSRTTPGFVPFVRRAQAAGIPVEIVSDGFGFFIEPALARARASPELPVVTARTTLAGDRPTIEFPNGHPTVSCAGRASADARARPPRGGPAGRVHRGRRERPLRRGLQRRRLREALARADLPRGRLAVPALDAVQRDRRLAGGDPGRLVAADPSSLAPPAGRSAAERHSSAAPRSGARAWTIRPRRLAAAGASARMTPPLESALAVAHERRRGTLRRPPASVGHVGELTGTWTIAPTTVAEAAAAGDADALARIVRAHHDDMARVCFVVCGDRTSRRTRCSPPGRSAWRKLGTLRDPARLRPWLVSIAVNEARPGMRRPRPAESTRSWLSTTPPRRQSPGTTRRATPTCSTWRTPCAGSTCRRPGPPRASVCRRLRLLPSWGARSGVAVGRRGRLARLLARLGRSSTMTDATFEGRLAQPAVAYAEAGVRPIDPALIATATIETGRPRSLRRRWRGLTTGRMHLTPRLLLLAAIALLAIALAVVVVGRRPRCRRSWPIVRPRRRSRTRPLRLPRLLGRPRRRVAHRAQGVSPTSKPATSTWPPAMARLRSRSSTTRGSTSRTSAGLAMVATPWSTVPASLRSST